MKILLPGDTKYISIYAMSHKKPTNRVENTLAIFSIIYLFIFQTDFSLTLNSQKNHSKHVIIQNE